MQKLFNFAYFFLLYTSVYIKICVYVSVLVYIYQNICVYLYVCACIRICIYTQTEMQTLNILIFLIIYLIKLNKKIENLIPLNSNEKFFS